jgi:hypothetical protein
MDQGHGLQVGIQDYGSTNVASYHFDFLWIIEASFKPIESYH